MGLRVEMDKGNERLAKQIRNAELSRIPIMAVVGEKEIEGKALAVRSRKGERAQSLIHFSPRCVLLLVVSS